MDLIINENEEQARELFHDIVVDASREIYESIMEEEMMDESMHEDDMDEGMGGQVGDLLDEISAEEEGMMEEDEMEMADEEESFDLEADGMDDEEAGEDEVEDAVIRIEDKLDRLMAEFESIMASDDMADDMADDDMDVEVDSEESEEEVMEAVQLQKVSVTHGDNGVQTKSTVAANSGQRGMASRPVHASTTVENGRTAPTTKDVKGAGSFKNAPGQSKQNLNPAPKPVTKDGSTNDRSPVAK